MRSTTLALLDEHGAPLDPPVAVTGRLTVARQPQPWEAPEGFDPAELATHLLAVPANTAGLAPLRYLEGDGRRWRVLGRVEISAGLDPRLERWRLRLEGRW